MKKSPLYSCDHIGIITNNAKRLEKFYIDRLGFKKEKDVILPKNNAKSIFGLNCNCKFIRLYREALKIELFQPLSKRLKSNINAIGNHHWGFLVKNRVRFCAGLKRKRVPIVEIDRGGFITYFAKDPDGNMIEIRD